LSWAFLEPRDQEPSSAQGVSRRVKTSIAKRKASAESARRRSAAKSRSVYMRALA
jgi:hypothetical protein